MLTQRKRNILKAIVGEYISSAAPVASGTIVRRHGLGVSPATVRHEMANLEEEGYIHRPHPSAGSVPSDKGYRFYVESLTDVAEPPLETQVVLQQRFQRAAPDIEAWIRLAAIALSEMIHNLAIVSFPRLPHTRLRHVELVYLQEFLVLLVLVLQEAKLSQQLVSLERPLRREEAVAMTNKLNASFAGLTREEIQEREQELSPVEGEIKEAALRLLAAADEEAYLDYHSDGLRHVLGQPEFLHSAHAHTLAEVLEDRALVRAVLGATPQDGVRVIIGEENQEDVLHPFSIVLCPYGLPGEAAGTILALGPTRMAYPTTISTASYLSSLMTRLLASVYG